MDEKITSRDNARVKYACRLAASGAFRKEEGSLFFMGSSNFSKAASLGSLSGAEKSSVSKQTAPSSAAPGVRFRLETISRRRRTSPITPLYRSAVSFG